MQARDAKAEVPRFVGIDVSRKTLAVAMDGEAAREFHNHEKGWETLIKAVLKGGRKSVRVVMEATGSYHFDAAAALAAADGIRVMVVNPRSAKAFHLARGKRAKTDLVDAESLLEMARRMDFVPWTAPSRTVSELRQLARYVEGMIKDRSRLKNQLHAATISKAASQFVSDDLTARIESLDERIATAESALAGLVSAEANLTASVKAMSSVPGIGTATATRLLSEFLVLDPEMTAKQITAYAGLDPRPKESGTSVRGARGISRYGNPRLRQMLYLPALAAQRSVGPFKHLAERVAERSGSKMVGVAAVMRKLLVTAWAVHRTSKTWDPGHAVRGSRAVSP
jgi:transposase